MKSRADDVAVVDVDLTDKEPQIMVPFLRTPYNYDRDRVSDETGLFCPEPSLTKQEFTQSCDVNYILDRFAKGMDVEFNVREPRYGDFTGLPQSYHEALNFIKKADQAFMELDARVRAKFDNDPAKFLAFIHDPKTSRDDLVEMGVADAAASMPTPVATPLPDEQPKAAPIAPKGAKKDSAKAESDSPSE